ncbi:MAG TPA: DUF1707 domain-containing protein [Gaiellaceae bacterium]|nr:DUF1707 domain-containing protein [Gaiellaceae bacterium]
MTDDVLASDAERDAAAAELRRHLAEGRLTTEEFGERVEAIYRARTQAEVSGALGRLPERAPQPPRRPGLPELAGRYAVQSSIPVVICVLVWAFTSPDGSFWPKWVILAMAIAFVSRIGKVISGDEEARAELERRFGGGHGRS